MAKTASKRELDNYYRDHWVEIDSERLRRYDEMFRVPPERVDALLKPLSLSKGHRVLDFGCGPGFVATEIARKVGPNGTVHAVDVNREFVAKAQVISEAAGISERLTAHHIEDETLPIGTGTLDRAFAKNVLEYVPEVLNTLKEKGVQIHRWNKDILDTLKTAWLEVVEEESAKDADFKRAWESLSSFRKDIKVWQSLGYLN